MRTFIALALFSLALTISAVAVSAAGPNEAAPRVEAEVSPSESESGFGVLPGRWVRPDGGYVITIKSVNAAGELDAAYANPNPLPFARAEATRDGETIKLFFELRAGGYNGSTYELTYDPLNDTLKGDYFQAVVQQKFDVYFARADE